MKCTALLLNGLQDVSAILRVSPVPRKAIFDEYLRNDVSPSNQTPVLVDSSADGDLLANFCACGASQGKLGGISLDTEDTRKEALV